MNNKIQVSLVPIDKADMEHFVSLAFEGDDKLLEQYHVSPGTLEHCVQHTMGFIEENVNHYKEDIKFFAVIVGEAEVGYTIIIENENLPNELYSFGINKKYRSEEVKTEWLKKLTDIFKTPYYIVLWSKNSRAINFFERNGFVVDRTNKLLTDETKTLIICRPVG